MSYFTRFEGKRKGIKQLKAIQPFQHFKLSSITRHIFQFVYDSEKPMQQNKILNEIHQGIRLRHVRTDDRSKPDFQKLGKVIC